MVVTHKSDLLILSIAVNVEYSTEIAFCSVSRQSQTKLTVY